MVADIIIFAYLVHKYNNFKKSILMTNKNVKDAVDEDNNHEMAENLKVVV